MSDLSASPLVVLVGLTSIVVALAFGAVMAFVLAREFRKSARGAVLSPATAPVGFALPPSPELAAEPMAEPAEAPPEGEATPTEPQKGDAKIFVRRLLTESEGRFYDFLNETVEGRYILQTKVPLKNMLKHYGRLEKELYIMLCQGHVDFLLLEPVTKRPVMCIELDGTTHDTPRGRDADRRKEELLRLANLPLRRIRVGKLWGSEEREVVLQALGQPALAPHNPQNGNGGPLR